MEDINKESPQEEAKKEADTQPEKESGAPSDTSTSQPIIKEIHHHHYDKRGFSFGRLLLGILIIVIGLGFLAGTLGWANWNFGDIVKLWPVIIIIIGVSFLSFRGWIGAIVGIIATIIVLAVICFLVFGSMAFNYGSSKVIEQDRTVSNFSKIQLNGAGNLLITQGDQESLKITGPENILSRINTNIDNGTLKIDFNRNWPMVNGNVDYAVKVKNLDAVTLNGAGKINSDYLNAPMLSIDIRGAGKAEMTVSSTDLRTNISGAGEIILYGTSTNLFGTISGVGNINAGNLSSISADISASGAGQATVNASASLRVRINGAGKVNYFGNPRIDQVISGAGAVEKKK